MFDYIRSANLYDTRVANPFAPGDSVKLGQGQVIPILDQKNGTKGFGRFPTVSKAFLIFIGNAENSPSLTPPITMNAWDAASNPTGVKPGNIRVQAGLFLEFFDPSKGFMHIYPKFQVKIDGLDNFRWGPVTNPTTPTVPMKGFPSSAIFKAYPSGSWKSYPFTVWDALVNETFSGGLMGWAPFVASKGSGTLGSSSGQDVYPFIAYTETASDFPVGGKFNFSGGTITVTILDNQTPPNGPNEIQKLTIDIPSSPAGAGGAESPAGQYHGRGLQSVPPPEWQHCRLRQFPYLRRAVDRCGELWWTAQCPRPADLSAAGLVDSRKEERRESRMWCAAWRSPRAIPVWLLPRPMCPRPTLLGMSIMTARPTSWLTHFVRG